MFERFLSEIWAILNDLAGPLLLGSLLAGIIHVLLPGRIIRSGFGKRNFRSVLNAALLGVPMPLCSCSVVPAAIGLKQDGASKGAATSFLISTPQTGIDSILVSAAFLGWPFAIFKVVAAFVTGLVGGTLVNKFDPGTENESLTTKRSSNNQHGKLPAFSMKFVEALRYGLFDLLGMIYRWIALGIMIAAFISMIFPPGSLTGIHWIGGIGGMFLMLLLALPMYVCTTGSVPIAASLISAGMPLGTALVFLMAGPATNIATVGALLKVFGAKMLTIYLLTIAVFSMLFGRFFDFVIGHGATVLEHQHGISGGLPNVLMSLAVIGIFIFLFAHDIYKKYIKRYKPIESKAKIMSVELNIKGMTCKHCAATVTRALSDVPGVKKANVYIEKGLAVIDGDVSVEKLIQSVRQAGYDAALRNRVG